MTDPQDRAVEVLADWMGTTAQAEAILNVLSEAGYRLTTLTPSDASLLRLCVRAAGGTSRERADALVAELKRLSEGGADG